MKIAAQAVGTLSGPPHRAAHRGLYPRRARHRRGSRSTDLSLQAQKGTAYSKDALCRSSARSSRPSSPATPES